MSDAPVVAIVGPTAVGKTAAAVALAQRIGGEVVGTDSMQAYIGMDIGTAKPTVDERAMVPHHVIDQWSPSEEISVVSFRDVARSAIADIESRGKRAVVVGGSWLYVQAIVDQMDFPPTDPDVRDRWARELDRIGAPALHAILRERDPGAADGIEPGNGRRIVRALEVVELTGSFAATLPEPMSWRDTLWLGLDCPRDDLDARIAARVERMWSSGFVEEVRRLRRVGLGRTAGKALGYAQVMAFLDGQLTEPAAKDEITRATIRFARRQQRRFRQDRRITWLDADAGDDDALLRLDQVTAM